MKISEFALLSAAAAAAAYFSVLRGLFKEELVGSRLETGIGKISGRVLGDSQRDEFRRDK